MSHLEFMSPQIFWWLVPCATICLLLAWHNLSVQDGMRKYWGEAPLLDAFSPRNREQSVRLWLQWVAFVLGLIFCLAGPNVSQAPEMVQSGAVQAEFIFDASRSMGAEDYRPYLPVADGVRTPDNSFQWGTRVDAAKYYLRKDLLPQLSGNEAGLITVMGAGYNMWDITRDLGANGAFQHVLDKFVQVGSAPGGGFDLTSGLKAALDEFDLIADLQSKAGDRSPKIRFITLFTDGGFSGDQAELDKVLNQLNEKKVRLLIVALGGTTPMTVSKFDERTHRRTKEFYAGTTRVDTKILEHIKSRVVNSTLIKAPPGTKALDYSFPQAAGGLYAHPNRANLKPWFLLLDCLLLVSITIGGGGRPRVRYIVPLTRESLSNVVSSVKNRLSRQAHEKDAQS